MVAGGFYEGVNGITYDDLRVSDMEREDVGIPAPNTVRQKTIAAVPNGRIVITYIHGWYDSEPTGGNIRIEYGASNVLAFRVPITGAGTGFMPVFKRAPAEQRVRVTLAPGGATVRGYLNVGYRVERAIP